MLSQNLRYLGRDLNPLPEHIGELPLHRLAVVSRNDVRCQLERKLFFDPEGAPGFDLRAGN
jgi:hypothetical protein